AERVDPVFWVMLKSTPYTGWRSLMGKKVGISQGQMEVPLVQKSAGRENVVLFADDATGIQGGINGQVAAYMAGPVAILRSGQFPELKAVALEVGDFDLPKEHVRNATRMFVACNNKGLAMAINNAIDELRASGELQRIIAKHFPADPESLRIEKDIPPDNCP